MSGCISDRVVVTVREIKGKCDAGFRVGDKVELIGDNVVKGPLKCLYAFNAIWPLLGTIAYGGKIPKSSPLYEDKDTFVGCCPDPKNLVVFEMKRGDAYWRTPDTRWTEDTHSFVPIPADFPKEVRR